MRCLPFAVFITCTALAGVSQEEDYGLGSGRRGLLVVHQPGWKVAFACDKYPSFEPSGTYYEAPHVLILHQETLDPDYLRTLPENVWGGWTSQGLFSFGPDAAFVGNTLFCIEEGHIRVHPGAARAEARKRYGLQDNEIFLGAFEGRVYYWVEGNPRVVYVRDGEGTRQFALGERVTKPIGMAKGDPLADLALLVAAKPAWAEYPAPRICEWVRLDLDQAQNVK